ncbi:hypothetical protein SAMN02745216_04132 [Desulfatibacillum alkenivorans DSM 16219]|jgi:hypothetical protein|uniref:Uncharacterized protein n=1 Tax=Desulfatibacillum alkenivorans DSM 16219 TaxID=1121393 RepID=A0A1M6VJD1_9BACT|nr:hypothetical protein [Desulfatibacillum alkenivorans]SHK81590.1 hypothetical protein SAMN02745216_04132 [Desulfatibacillum alkenivorans DSM 16219]
MNNNFAYLNDAPAQGLEREVRAMRSHFSGTIWYALACGLAFIPAYFCLNLISGPYWAFRMTLWVFLAGYAWLLRRWSGGKFLTCLFPLFLLLVLAFAGLPQTNFLVAAIVILAWIRSGVCFAGKGARSLAVELGVSAGGALLVNLLAPHSGLTWALAVWLFFLVQSLFFVMGPDSAAQAWIDPYRPEPFEQARQRAERILSEE